VRRNNSAARASLSRLDTAESATAAQINTHDVSSAVIHAYDFSWANCVIDVGGGAGHLMSALLQTHAHLRGVVLERVPTLALAWRELKHAGLTQRCECVAGNFFDAVPSGGDIYVLKHVLCDWNDSASIAILRRCRAAMMPFAKLLVIDNIFESGHASATPFAAHMAIAAGGHVRTEREYLALLNEAGFGGTRTLTTASSVSLIEVRR
jgi:O-methyltransferase domain